MLRVLGKNSNFDRGQLRMQMKNCAETNFATGIRSFLFWICVHQKSEKSLKLKKLWCNNMKLWNPFSWIEMFDTHTWQTTYTISKNTTCVWSCLQSESSLLDKNVMQVLGLPSRIHKGNCGGGTALGLLTSSSLLLYNNNNIYIYIFFFFFGEGWECKRTQERLTEAKNKKRVTEVLQTKDCYKQKFTSIKISFDLYYMRYWLLVEW